MWACVAGVLYFLAGDTGSDPALLTTALCTALMVATATRRVAPTLSVICVVAYLSARIAIGPLSFITIWFVAPIVYSFSTHTCRAVRWATLGAVAAASVAGGWKVAQLISDPTTVGRLPDIAGVAISTALVAVVPVAAWAAGMMKFQRDSTTAAQIAAARAEAERARAIEAYAHEAARSQIARDVHDVVAHSLAVIIAQADGARYSLQRSPSSIEPALGAIAATGRSSLLEVRGFLERLRADPQAREVIDDGLDEEQLIARMRAAGLRIDHHVIGDPETTSPATAHAVLRILGEALTNALKHGDRREAVIVRQRWDDPVTVEVVNVTAAPVEERRGEGYGTISMAERARLAGGSLDSRRVGNKWVVTAVLPRDGSLRQ
ncbi:histidine kinase [Gordonia amicalis]|uniref:sensor histidine kinase n=1 Tax=Gordonia amicalis TaxID=89053 RepID=UPI00295525A3|nr:histidine kinase [Gordonia amicalis]MDV7098837.1 histidine kinase [Gordonia amicalis]